jgi:tetratricopeptide (TPR) repeat protein
MIRKLGTGMLFCVSALLFAASCYGYRVVPFERKLAPGTRVPGREAGAAKNTIRITARRHLALMRSFSPVAGINNRAVALCSPARLAEAEILFREALAEDRGAAAAYNNLGVVCEMLGRRDEAFRMYSAACMMEPDNAVFRDNFLGFTDSRPAGE